MEVTADQTKRTTTLLRGPVFFPPQGKDAHQPGKSTVAIFAACRDLTWCRRLLLDAFAGCLATGSFVFQKIQGVFLLFTPLNRQLFKLPVDKQ